jgi:Na+/H+ antiporter NhaD/arsenite permease-like protein
VALTKGRKNLIAYSFLTATGACITTATVYNLNIFDFVPYVPLSSLIYLLTMNLFILMVEQQKVFQYAAVQIIHITNSNPRLFFYVICLLAAVISGVMEDVSVSLIFIPLVIRTAKILKIEPVPFILGITFAITIGNILTPYSSPTNIVLADYFNLSVSWFLSQFWLLFVILFAVFFIILDFKSIRRQPPPSEQQIRILMEIMDPNLLIVDRKRFIRNGIYVIVLFGTLIFTSQPYLVSLIGMVLISIIEREPLKQYMKDVDWNLLFFLISLFLITGCLRITGFIDSIVNLFMLVFGSNFYLAIILLMILASLMGSFLSRTLTVVVFAAILQSLFATQFTSAPEQTVLLMAFVIAVNLGGNLVPMASTHMLKTLNIAEDANVEKMTYSVMVKACLYFVLLTVGIGFVYVMIVKPILTIFG